jgi:hypothetical protein
MIRGLPDDYLFPGNNKVWHGTVALHFCFFLMVRIAARFSWNTERTFLKKGVAIQMFYTSILF